MKLSVVCFAALLTLACSSPDMWIPVETTPRMPVNLQHVMYLDEMPSKPYIVIGVITPPPDEYETEAEMIKAIRGEAAKHGADAIFIESRTEKDGWHFSGGRFGVSGGTGTTVDVRAKAIVWRE